MRGGAVILSVGDVVISVAVLTALLVLPGFSLEVRTSKAELRGVLPLVRAFVVSLAIETAVGALLLATGTFSAVGMTIVAAAFAIVGLVPFGRWLVATVSGAGRLDLIVLGALVAMLVPWMLMAVDPGLPRSSTFEWYYWQVGRQLSEAHGIPSAVPEYGQLVRWLPDYLGFNVVSEAYRGALPFIPDEVLISAWRIPIAGAGLGGLYLVLRLWLHVGPALVGLAAIATTAFFVTKFNVYKPESVGVVLGVVATLLLVSGARQRRPSSILWSGLAIGLAVSVHAIAATVFGLLMVAAGVVELLRARGHQLELFRALGAAAALSVVLVVALGWSLQGRVVVISDALRPTLVSGEDPTWTYLRRSNGDFSGRQVPPRLIDEVASSVSRPWPNEPILAGRNHWLIGVAAAGVLLALGFATRLVRLGVVVGLLAGVLIVAAMGAFAVAFETYVPRHTGLGRIGQYVPLLVGTVLGFAAAGYQAAWSRIVDRRVPLFAGILATAVAFGLAVPIINGSYYANETRLPPSGRAALEALRSMAGPDDVAISNAITYGTIEFFSGVEAPLEGRQPLIEEPQLLEDVNGLLISMNRYLLSSLNREAVEAVNDLGFRWLIVVDDPSTLGADDLFGGSIARFTDDPTVRLAWQGDGVAIYESALPHAAALQLQPGQARPNRFVAASLALIASSVMLVLIGNGSARRRLATGVRRLCRRGVQPSM
jgi:hypothetical protein